MENKISSQFDSLLQNNSAFVVFLAICPGVAVCDSVISALGMGVAIAIVLILSNIIMSLVAKMTTGVAKLFCDIITVASLVTLVNMLISAFVPAVVGANADFNLYLSLTTISCLLINSTQFFGKSKPVGKAVVGSVVKGVMVVAVLFVVAAVREVLGAGTFAGIEIPFMADFTTKALCEVSGGLLVYGVVAAVVGAIAKCACSKKEGK